jgi:hypothetical protein
MAVPIEAAAKAFRVSNPEPLFQIHVTVMPPYIYDTTGDGTKFLVIDQPETENPITVVLNWEARFRKR